MAEQRERRRDGRREDRRDKPREHRRDERNEPAVVGMGDNVPDFLMRRMPVSNSEG